MLLDIEILQVHEEWQKLGMWDKGLFAAACCVAELDPNWPRRVSLFEVKDLVRYIGRPMKRLLPHIAKLEAAKLVVCVGPGMYLISRQALIRPANPKRRGWWHP